MSSFTTIPIYRNTRNIRLQNLIRIAVGLWLCVSLNHVFALECSLGFFNDSKSPGELKLCQSTHTGKQKLYSCLDVIAEQTNYRIFFSGGRIPKAIFRYDLNKERNAVIWSLQSTSEKPICTLSSPDRLPLNSEFMGAGVCEDEQGDDVACAIFQSREPRRKLIDTYMVFYDEMGGGPTQAVIINSRANEDAMVAELAYQIGQKLIGSTCCQQEGYAYLKYANQLFPDSVVYRNNYSHSEQ